MVYPLLIRRLYYPEKSLSPLGQVFITFWNEMLGENPAFILVQSGLCDEVKFHFPFRADD